MRILFATAELAPVVTVGGLGSAASGLVRALRALGHDVDVVLPDYGAFALDGETIAHIEGPDWAGSLTVRTGVHAQVGALTLIGSSAISKPHPYLDADGNGWPDNNERFFGFSYAVAHLAADRKPDILHVNDWHTAAALSMLDPAHLPATVLSVHNLA